MFIVFVSETCSESVYKDIQKRRGVPVLPTQQRFTHAIADGLSMIDGTNVQCVTAVPISYGTTQGRVWNLEDDSERETLSYRYLFIINGRLMRFITTAISSCISIGKILRHAPSEKEKFMLCDPINMLLSAPARRIAKKKGWKTIAIITDIPEFITHLHPQRNPVRRIVQKLYDKLSSREMNAFDGYVLLAEKMSEYVNSRAMPSVIIEGLIEESDVMTNEGIVKNTYPKIVLYAGSLGEKSGIIPLLEAFTSLDLPFWELHIYGVGDQVELVKKFQQKDERIRYCGVLSNEEMIRREKQAMLLVNPRSPREKFTELSFPSKILEYMSTGTATITTRLLSIPSDYEPYLFWFSGDTAESMKCDLERVLNLPFSELKRVGNEGKEFVMNMKNNNIQSEIILDFVRREVLR